MKIHIPYGTSGINFELPDKNVYQIMFPYLEKPLADFKAEVLNGLRNPIGSPPLEEIIKKKGIPGDIKTVILCDDMTRPTPRRIYWTF